jgi:hypothetical protein
MIEEAFIKLKEAVTKSFILTLPHFTKPFTIKCDVFRMRG